MQFSTIKLKGIQRWIFAIKWEQKCGGLRFLKNRLKETRMAEKGDKGWE